MAHLFVSFAQSLKFWLRRDKKELVNLPNDLFLHNFGIVMEEKLHFGKGHESILRRESRKVVADNINWKTVPRLWSVKWNSNWPSTTEIGESFMWSILALQPWPRNCFLLLPSSTLPSISGQSFLAPEK